MRFKVGDKVRIKSIDWYRSNKDAHGNIDCGEWNFTNWHAQYCSSIMTIAEVWQYDECYIMHSSDCHWTDEMIEGLVGCDNKMSNVDKLKRISTPAKENWFEIAEEWEKEDKEMGKFVAEKVSGGITIKEPKYNKLSINTELCDDKVELVISPDFEVKQEGDKWFAVKKKKEYPKTYEECCKVLGYVDKETFCIFHTGADERLFENLYCLKVCRDAYWKIAGEEMGLGKPWKPDWKNEEGWIHCITNDCGEICCTGFRGGNKILAFPTEEMRDAFKENFDKDLETCKELL